MPRVGRGHVRNQPGCSDGGARPIASCARAWDANGPRCRISPPGLSWEYGRTLPKLSIRQRRINDAHRQCGGPRWRHRCASKGCAASLSPAKAPALDARGNMHLRLIPAALLVPPRARGAASQSMPATAACVRRRHAAVRRPSAAPWCGQSTCAAARRAFEPRTVTRDRTAVGRSARRRTIIGHESALEPFGTAQTLMLFTVQPALRGIYGFSPNLGVRAILWAACVQTTWSRGAMPMAGVPEIGQNRCNI